MAEEIQKSHDDDGVRKVQVPSHYDEHRILIEGSEADRTSRTIINRFNATIPYTVFGSIRKIEAEQATYIPEISHGSVQGGVAHPRGLLDPPVDHALLEPGVSILTLVKDPTGFPRQWGDQPITFGETYFLKTSLSFKVMTRKLGWDKYASMAELIDALSDPGSESTDRAEIPMCIHLRLLRPILALNLLFMSLPLVLGGYGRNMFINLGFALGNSAIFYGTLLLCEYLGSNDLLIPSLAAWLPLFAFALLATWRWDRIRT